MSHPCPVPGCAVQNVPDKLLMCKRHWRRVPAELQSEVWRTWWGRKRARDGGNIENILAGLRAYHAAEHAAIDAALAGKKHEVVQPHHGNGHGQFPQFHPQQSHARPTMVRRQ